MSTVLEIQEAASRLDEHDQEALVSWLLDQSSAWDRRIEQDAAAGKLDFLVEQAKMASRKGELRPWPGKA